MSFMFERGSGDVVEHNGKFYPRIIGESSGMVLGGIKFDGMSAETRELAESMLKSWLSEREELLSEFEQMWNSEGGAEMTALELLGSPAVNQSTSYDGGPFCFIILPSDREDKPGWIVSLYDTDLDFTDLVPPVVSEYVDSWMTAAGLATLWVQRHADYPLDEDY